MCKFFMATHADIVLACTWNLGHTYTYMHTHSDTLILTSTADSAFNAFKMPNLNYIENIEYARAKFCRKC